MAANSNLKTNYDCIIIGAGHNGLICAAYLAKAGKQVLVVEAAADIGGAAATHEFVPNFKVSSAHLLHLMPQSLISELGLEKHGLRLAAQELASTALSADGKHLNLSASGVAAQSPADAASYRYLLH